VKFVRGNGKGGIVKKGRRNAGLDRLRELANTRGEKATTAFVPPTGGEGRKTFWAPVETDRKNWFKKTDQLLAVRLHV
jgi:phage antirepressor YoqD-like protein